MTLDKDYRAKFAGGNIERSLNIPPLTNCSMIFPKINLDESGVSDNSIWLQNGNIGCS